MTGNQLADRGKVIAKCGRSPDVGKASIEEVTLFASGMLAPRAFAAVPATSDALSDTVRKNSFVSFAALMDYTTL